MSKDNNHPEAVHEGDVIETTAGKAGRRYVVIDARWNGGSQGMDAWPNTWQVEAHLLHESGEYDPDGSQILFSQKGQSGAHCYTNAHEARIVGKMRKTYVE
jgi:hypothetical protein